MRARPVGGEPRAQGLASESLLSQEPHGAHVLCLPSRLWAPRLGGGVWRSRQAESSRRAPFPQDTPQLWTRGAQEVTLAVDNWTGVRAQGRHRSAVGPEPGSAPHLSARCLPGVMHTQCSAVVPPTRGVFPKEPRWHLPRPQPCTAVPFLASLRLVRLVPKDACGSQGGPAGPREIRGLESSGSWKVPVEGPVHTCVCPGHRQ